MKNDKEFIVQSIRAQYTERENSGLEKLRSLDRRVKRPANVFAYTFGAVSAIIMGSGMSLVMTDIGELIGITEPMLPGIVIGVVGMVMALITYPAYKRILKIRKNKYAKEILALSESIMNN